MRSRLYGRRYVTNVTPTYAMIAVSAANPVIQMRLRKNSSGATCQLRLGMTLEIARRTESVDARTPVAWPDIHGYSHGRQVCASVSPTSATTAAPIIAAHAAAVVPRFQ